MFITTSDQATFTAELAQLSYLNSVNFSQQPIHPSTRSISKRLIDIIGAIIGLIITAFVTIPVAIATQIDDPGPIFYSQIRCGILGKPFRIWKFRSMVVNADELKHGIKNEATTNQMFKCLNDTRITRVGRLLRSTSLDEFPQFWNVLKGDMSLVGTRPPTPEEAKQYQKHHWQRLDVKPGITGVWQANGRSSINDFEIVVNMDIHYQQNWSITYDLSLIFQTIWVVFQKTGAY